MWKGYNCILNLTKLSINQTTARLQGGNMKDRILKQTKVFKKAKELKEHIAYKLKMLMVHKKNEEAEHKNPESHDTGH